MPLSIVNLSPLLATSEAPELGPGPRQGVVPLAKLDEQFEKIVPASSTAPLRRQLLKAIVYVWHDHLDSAHSISQAIATPDGSYVHGIVHRREPDYGNARYWFQRVGKHAAYPEIAGRAFELLRSVGDKDLLPRIVPGGAWNAVAFVDECEENADEGARANLLRQLQAAEIEVLMKYFAS